MCDAEQGPSWATIRSARRSTRACLPSSPEDSEAEPSLFSLPPAWSTEPEPEPSLFSANLNLRYLLIWWVDSGPEFSSLLGRRGGNLDHLQLELQIFEVADRTYSRWSFSCATRARKPPPRPETSTPVQGGVGVVWIYVFYSACRGMVVSGVGSLIYAGRCALGCRCRRLRRGAVPGCGVPALASEHA